MFDRKSIFAFIPAKTNSVGLPGKMFKKIGDYNLFQWTLYAAYKSEYIDEVVVSTNDQQIEQEIKTFDQIAANILHIKPKKVLFVRRPNELCLPSSKTEDAITQFLLEYYSYRMYDYMVLLQPTSPIRWKNLIDSCVQNCVGIHDSLITVEKHTPFFWRKNSETQTIYPTYSLKNRPMRQEIQEQDFYFKDNGNVYITNVARYLQYKIRVSGKVCLHEIDKIASMQIDTQEDFDMIECVYSKFGAFV